MLDFARDMRAVCPNALMLNYTNPMPTISTAMTRAAGIKYVGLCHSVQGCATGLLRHLGMLDDVKKLQWKIAGINHMSWLLEITDDGKDLYPQLIDELEIPLDEYPRRCIRQIEEWKTRAKTVVGNKELDHKRTHEYGSYIMDAMETGVPFTIGGNVLNTGLITNLPSNMAVEVPCLVDRNGVQGCYVGDLPPEVQVIVDPGGNGA